MKIRNDAAVNNLTCAPLVLSAHMGVEYSLVLSKRPPLLIKFRKFFPSRRPYLDPPLINFGIFLLQKLKYIQKYTVRKGYFD